MNTKRALHTSPSPARSCVARFTNTLFRSRRCVTPLFAGLNIARLSRPSQVRAVFASPDPFGTSHLLWNHILAHSCTTRYLIIPLESHSYAKHGGWRVPLWKSAHPVKDARPEERSDEPFLRAPTLRGEGSLFNCLLPTVYSAPVAAPPPRCHNRISLGGVVLRGLYGFA